MITIHNPIAYLRAGSYQSEASETGFMVLPSPLGSPDPKSYTALAFNHLSKQGQ